jgi:oligoendopeptidase F
MSELMTQAQRKLYGDTLLSDGTDPMFWAYKMHFFITGVSFYNFPYVFGYLLSQARDSKR